VAEKQGIHCLIGGRVQGVCFRAETEAVAGRLGLTGWVRNLPDGRVEVKAFGPADKLDELRDWLQHGPAMAQVLKLDYESIDHEEYPGFTVAPTLMNVDYGPAKERE